jgi:1-acyl-sn-glycerol-3-phosphate acyltransferase
MAVNKRSYNKSKMKKRKNANTVVMDHSALKPTLLQYTVVFLGMGWMVTIPLTLASIPFIWENSKIFVVIYCSIVMFSIVYTLDRKAQPNWGYAFGAFMMRNCTSYFKFKIEFEDLAALERAGGPVLYATEPHGVMPLGAYWGNLNLVSDQKILCCLSSSLLQIPIMKHLLTWTDAISADKETMVKHLNQGYSLNICPGGVKEVGYLGDPSTCVMFLRSRYGFTKLALEHGIPIVPSVTFGLQNAYDYWVPKWDIIKPLASRLGFYPMIFLGLGGIPFFQPKPCAMSVVVGAPIMIPKTPDPSKEVIARYHATFVSEVERIFEDNKSTHGMAGVRLEIK